MWKRATEKINSLGVAPRTVKDVKTNGLTWYKRRRKRRQWPGYTEGLVVDPPSRALSPITERVVELFGDSPSFNGIVGVETPFTHGGKTSRLIPMYLKILAYLKILPQSSRVFQYSFSHWSHIHCLKKEGNVTIVRSTVFKSVFTNQHLTTLRSQDEKDFV